MIRFFLRLKRRRIFFTVLWQSALTFEIIRLSFSLDACSLIISVLTKPGKTEETRISLFSYARHSVKRYDAAFEAEYAEIPAKGQSEDELEMFTIAPPLDFIIGRKTLQEYT